MKAPEKMKNMLAAGGRAVFDMWCLAKLSLAVMCKVELVSGELVCRDRDISKQSVEGATWFLLPVCHKRWQGREEL